MASDASSAEISPDELAARIESGERVPLLDVRNRDELDAWRIAGPNVDLTHVPYMKFVSAQATGGVTDLVDTDTDTDTAYVVVCPRGEASAEAAEMLRAAGVDAVNLAGGMHGWARVYQRTEVAVDATEATVYQYRRPASGCLAYLVVSGGEAAVVDPLLAFADRYAEDADTSGATVEYVLDTHVHADHFSGLRAVAETTTATPVVSEGAANRGIAYDVETVADGDALTVGDCSIEVLATPGHTTGSVSLCIDDLLLSGDSLFLDGAPRPDLQRGDDDAPEFARTLHETLTERLASLPESTLVAPGHYRPGRPFEPGGYTASLGALRQRLAAFSETPAAFLERILDSMGAPPANHERIVAVNLGTETVTEADAFEMELGPNNCAVAE